jgi:hypothetical protein
VVVVEKIGGAIDVLGEQGAAHAEVEVGESPVHPGIVFGKYVSREIEREIGLRSANIPLDAAAFGIVDIFSSSPGPADAAVLDVSTSDKQWQLWM